MSDSEKQKKKRGGEDSDEEEKKMALKVNSYSDIQRFKLEKLMKDPSKPAFIPERRAEKNYNVAPEFNHNIMGSSAGAGSGEFHLYRQMRRKEQVRLQVLGERLERDDLNEAYHAKLEENQKLADEKTAKKRKKRQKQKEKLKQKKKNPKQESDKSESSEAEDSDKEDTVDNTISETAKQDSNQSNDSSKPTSKTDLKPVDNITESNDKKKGLTLVYYNS